MYDSGKIIAGIVVFIAIFTSPIWYNLAVGTPAPDIVLPEGKCIESTEYMRAHHMEMLNQWRNLVVREGNRVYTATDGKEYNMSLTETCLGCHDDITVFCDRCHAFASVNPTCFDCHLDTKAR